MGHQLDIAGIQELWLHTKGDARICVACLDGDADLSHVAFRGADINRLSGRQPPNAGPAFLHGTQVASLIFGQHNEAMEGVAPGCSGLIIPIFEDENDRIRACSELDLARAIGMAVQNRVQIINVSGGKFSDSGLAHPILENALQLARDSGILIVAAAGNDGCFCQHVPSASANVLTVGAVDSKGEPLPSSNWGAAYQLAGIVALGHELSAAAPSDCFQPASGTSFATAIVSGVAALLMSLQLKHGHEPDAEVVRNALLQTAEDCSSKPTSHCERLLAGRLNVSGAFEFVLRHIGVSTAAQSAVNEKRGSTSTSMTQDKGHDARSPHLAIPTTNQLSTAKEPPSMTPQNIDNNSGNTCDSLLGQQRNADNVTQRDDQSSSPIAPQLVPSSSTSDDVSCDKVSQVVPSASMFPSAACSCNPGATQLVYVMGSLRVDFPSRTRREAIDDQLGDGKTVYHDKDLLAYFENKPWDAQSVEWVLMRNEAPLYAIRPQGPYAARGYESLREFLKDQVEHREKNQRVFVAIAGYLGGEARLSDKTVVPVLIPEIDGMYDWESSELLATVGVTQETPEFQALDNFLKRMTIMAENLGVAPQDRARNFATTNLLNLVQSLSDLFGQGYLFDTVEISKSEICHPEGDCYKIRTFFFPPDLTKPRRVIEYTIDVSGVIPIKVADETEYHAR